MFKGGYKLQTPVFEVGGQLDVEFPYVEAFYVFSVQIYHISVGNAPAALCGKESVFLAPDERLFRHQAVVGSVKIFDQIVCKVEREFSACCFIEFGAYALAEYA